MSMRRRWLLGGGIAGLATVALVVTVTVVGHRPAPAVPPVRVALTGPAFGAGADAGNIRAAKAEAREMLADLGRVLGRASAGARRDLSSPTAALDRQTDFYFPDDRRLARVAWWSVPMPPAALTAYLTAHPVQGHRVTSWGRDEADGRWTSQGALLWQARPGLTRGELAVAVRRVPGGSAVRADTFVDPIHVRLPGTMAGGSVTSVNVSIHPFGHAHGPSHSVLVTRPDQVATLVNEFDALPGSHIDDADHSCPGGLEPPYEVDLVFHTGTGTLSARDLPASCVDDSVVVSRDGIPQRPTLDGGGADDSVPDLAAQVEHLVGWVPKQLVAP